MAEPPVNVPHVPFNAMIPASLTVTPPAPPSKRQRSRDSRIVSARTGPAHLDTDDGPPPSPGLQIPAFLNQAKGDIVKLFQDLEWRQRFRLQHAIRNPESSPFRVERSPLVFSRNRYGNVQPWDQSRIRLKDPIGGSDYVNASPISLRSRPGSSALDAQSPPSLNQPPSSNDMGLPGSKYIATQGPKVGQFSHFWHMVMQETVAEIGVIVMLTPCWEGSKEKCGEYFPCSMDVPILELEPDEDEGENEPSNPNGDPFLDSDPASADADSDPAEEPSSDRSTPELESRATIEGTGMVTLLEMYYDDKSRSEVRKLRLQIRDESKIIWHYLFTGWPDFAKPEGDDRRALLELIKQSAEKAGNPSTNPRFIHCSAGVGRTGTFIALDHLLRELAQGKLQVTSPGSSRPYSSSQHMQSSPESSENGSTDSSILLGKESNPEAKEDVIFETVNSLRAQRMMMVMGEIQFSFLYEVLREAYVEMYSPHRSKVVGSGAGELRDGPDAATLDADMAEPSPKMARTANMLFIGPGGVGQEGRREGQGDGVVNAEAVAANRMIVQSEENGGDPYAAALMW